MRVVGAEVDAQLGTTCPSRYALCAELARSQSRSVFKDSTLPHRTLPAHPRRSPPRPGVPGSSASLPLVHTPHQGLLGFGRMGRLNDYLNGVFIVAATKVKFVRPPAGTVVETTGVHQFVQGTLKGHAMDIEGRDYLELVDANGEVRIFNKGSNFKFDLVVDETYTLRSYYGLRRGANGDPDSMGTCYQQMLGTHPESDFIPLEYKGVTV